MNDRFIVKRKSYLASLSGCTSTPYKFVNKELIKVKIVPMCDCLDPFLQQTLGQLVNRGAPMVYGSSTSMMDMKTTLSSMGAPEMAMISAAAAKLAQFYRMPSWVGGG